MMNSSNPTHSSGHTSGTCSVHETQLSAILDGELAGVDLPATLDHLLDCPGCQDFYRKSRALGLAVSARDVADGDDVDSTLDRVWARIGEHVEWTSVPAGERVDRRQRASVWRSWAPRLAAVLVVGFGLWLVPMLLRDAAGGSSPFRDAERAAVAGDAEVQVRPGELEMSEGRFVELTTEVLRADPRFHQKMLEVMKAVTRSSHQEGAVDVGRGDGGDDEEEPYRGVTRSTRSLL